MCPGGHTSEMLQLLKGMNFERYKPRIYIISEGDQFSAAKAAELEFGPNPPSVGTQLYHSMTLPKL